MSFLLAHLSDPHIGPLPRPRRRDLLGKRLTGYINWTRGRSAAHDMAMLGRIVEDLKAQHPNHVAMTGDILNIGLPAEFALARVWLETLGSPEDVSFVPGNHDAYVRGSLPDLARTFVPWTTGETKDTMRYPYLRVRGPVAMIGLCSGVPTPPFIASGRLGKSQIAAGEALLRDAAKRGLVRVLMIHHPPQAGLAMGRGLSDARDFEGLIRRTGAELVLHGHNHRSSVTHIQGLDRPVPIVGVPSASAIRGTHNHRAAYHLFEITGEGRDCRIEARARGILPGTSTIGDLGKFAL